MRELAIIRDGAMLIRGSQIEAVGSRSQIEAILTSDAQIIDAGGRVVTPGFVDAHTHLVFAGNRADEFEMRCSGITYQEIAKQGGGIRSTVRRTRAATEDDLLSIAQKHASWFLRGGTTTIEAKSGYGLTVEAEMKILRVVRQTGQTSPCAACRPFSVLMKCRRSSWPHQRLRRSGDRGDASAGSGGEAGQLLRRLLRATHLRSAGRRAHSPVGAKFRAGLRIHADQFSCSGGAMLAADLGAATADHLEHTDAASIAALAAANVQPVLLPGSVYSIGSRHYPPARAMIDAGLAVVLATDFNPGSSPIASMPVVMSLACTQMRMIPAETITAATINARIASAWAGKWVRSKLASPPIL